MFEVASGGLDRRITDNFIERAFNKTILPVSDNFHSKTAFRRWELSNFPSKQDGNPSLGQEMVK